MNLRVFPDRDALVAGTCDGMERVVSRVLAPAIGYAGPLARVVLATFARATDRPVLAAAIAEGPWDDAVAVALETSGDRPGWVVSCIEALPAGLDAGTIDLLIVDALTRGSTRIIESAAARSAHLWFVAADLARSDDVALDVARWRGLDSGRGAPDGTWWFIDVASRGAVS